MVRIALLNNGGELAKVELSDDDATVEAIARAAIDIIQSGGAMRVGDCILVTEEAEENVRLPNFEEAFGFVPDNRPKVK